MSKTLGVLIVEDSEDDVLILVRHLTKNGFSPDYEVVETAEDMKTALGKREWDLVISDHSMPEFDGLSALMVLRESGIDLPFIIVSGEIGEEVAVSAMRAGAHDYMMKGNLARLGPAIKRELQEAKERRKRKKAEEALSESEKRHRNLYRKTPAVLHSIDSEGKLISVSDTWLEKFGYTRDEVIGRKSVEFLTEESRQFSVKEAISKMTERGHVANAPLQFVKKNGEVMDILLSATVEFDENGDYLRTLAILNDVTARKKAEKELLERMRLSSFAVAVGGVLTYGGNLREMLQQCTEVVVKDLDVALARVWVIDETGDTLELIGSAGLHTHTDGPHGRVPVGKYKIGLIAEEGLPHRTNDIANDSRVHDKKWVTEQGLVGFAGYPLIFEDEVVGVMAMFSHEQFSKLTFDGLNSIATAIAVGIIRAQTEQAVEQLRKKNELILVSAGEGIYGIDNNGNTTFINPAAAEILGWEQEDLIGKPQHKIIHHTKPDGSKYKREDCPIYAAFSDGKVHREDDEVFWRKDGTSLPVEYTSTPIRVGENDLVGAVVTFRDVTARKKAEKELKDALEQVEQLKDKLQAENVYLQEEIKLEHNFDEIIGSSESFRRVLSNVEMVASTDATVLILGETGTGKELIARALHKLSPRKKRALVKVNCAALPAELIESELFGHEKGAFTSAVAQKQGRFELADSGTIFLDEIGDLPMDQQAKLLRVLQEGEFERVGGTRTIKADVRVIAATNANLEKAVEAGDFREDLFYRLNVFPITLPPLRERQKDIPLLVKHFIQKYGSKFGKEITDVPRPVMNSLQNYSFQGNIRELENIIERAVILSQDQTLRLGENLAPLKVETAAAATVGGAGTLVDVERNHITAVLNESNWRIEGENGAAPRLGLKPSTLRSRMQKLGIKRPGG